MPKIIGSVFQSLDGVMQAPGGPTEDWTGGFANGGWLPAVGDDLVGEAIGRLFREPFDLLLDRLTLMTFPVVLGHGKRLFGDGTAERARAGAARKDEARGCSTLGSAGAATAPGPSRPGRARR
ncbi:hypothetical protein [Sphingomonas sp.]|uniref:hypothetical protein n=1 Tax=Sphingomonas sp. TaxID=28214 RepID=UPI0037536198